MKASPHSVKLVVTTLTSFQKEERYVSSSTTNIVRSGIDLHLKRTYLVVMNRDGEIIEEKRLENASYQALHSLTP
jgi:hypothetical protein